MAKPSLELRQSQSLVMTEQLQQSIKLLQLSALELTGFIEQELEKNPLLSLEEPGETSETSPSDSDPEKLNEEFNFGDSDGLASEEHNSGEEDAYSRPIEMSRVEANNASSHLDTNQGDFWGDTGDTRYSGASDFSDDDGGSSSFTDMLEQRYSERQDLKSHLREQIQVDIANPAQKIIAWHLVDMVDDAGYLREETKSLVEQLGATKEEIEVVIKLVQRCEPAGVFARSLKECLSLQLKERGLLDEPMRILLDNLDLVAAGELKKLCRACGVTGEELSEMLAGIRQLNPRPGSDFLQESADTLIPDVFIRKVEKEGWKVELNNEVLPKLIVNRQYHALLSDQSRRKDDKKFLNEQLSNANWLIRSLDQRAQTLLKVSSEIVRQQKEFFEFGIHFLKPMTLKHIAEAIEMHESTVSRVTTGKYLATPRGVLEMKFFFSSSLNDSGAGEAYSSRTVMHMIKEMVDQENPAKILSDDTIADELQKRGVEVARRTVVKYRQNLNIPSSVERRRKKRLGQAVN